MAESWLGLAGTEQWARGPRGQPEAAAGSPWAPASSLGCSRAVWPYLLPGLTVGQQRGLWPEEGPQDL